jgi:hypothetical protein
MAPVRIQAFRGPTRLRINIIEKNYFTISAVLFVQPDCQPIIICGDVTGVGQTTALNLSQRSTKTGRDGWDAKQMVDIPSPCHP